MELVLAVEPSVMADWGEALTSGVCWPGELRGELRTRTACRLGRSMFCVSCIQGRGIRVSVELEIV